MYQYGLGVPRDYVIAASWLHQAAEQGTDRRDNSYSAFCLIKATACCKIRLGAEVWLNLAAARAEARQQEYFARIRDAVAQKLTLNQLAEAAAPASASTPIVTTFEPFAARY